MPDLSKIITPLLLFGPPGIGKTSYVSHIWRDIPVEKIVTINCHGGLTAEHLLGSPILRPDGSGATVSGFVDGPLIEAAARGFLFMDDLDELPPHLFSLLYPLLDRRSIEFFDGIQSRKVLASGIRVVACANALTKLPSALIDRFVVFEFQAEWITQGVSEQTHLLLEEIHDRGVFTARPTLRQSHKLDSLLSAGIDALEAVILVFFEGRMQDLPKIRALWDLQQGEEEEGAEE